MAPATVPLSTMFIFDGTGDFSAANVIDLEAYGVMSAEPNRLWFMAECHRSGATLSDRMPASV